MGQLPVTGESVCACSKKKMHHTVTYWAWTWTFHRYTGLCIVLQTILNLTLSQRKDLLGLCRVQSFPIKGSSLRQSMQHLSDIILIPSEPSRKLDETTFVTSTILDLIQLYQLSFTNHLTAAIIAHALRIAPGIEPEDFRSMFLKTVAKEMTAAINRFNHVPLDFRSIFSADASHRSIPLCSRLPPSEEVASDTFIRFCHLRNSLSNRFIFPRGGNKTVGRQVSKEFWKIYYQSNLTFKHESGSKEDQVTIDDCLRMYQETGGFPGGPVEMRTSWKYSQINPRVYYARGGDVQPAAQYIQEIVNIMIDSFPEVHRLDRFSPPTEPLSDGDVEVIYDFASFTSNLDAVVPFVDSLSQFFRGVNIFTIDPRDGICLSDLGDLFEDYNRTCNSYQSFDVSRLSLVGDSDSSFQHTCGMLGIEGNIFIATLLHGILTRFVAGLGRSKVVGDDARCHFATVDGQFSSADREYLFWMLSSIGDLNVEKIMAFEAHPTHNQDFRYIKRPFYRSGSIMMSGLLLALPSQIPLTGPLDSFHTVIPSSTHPCRIVFKQIVRFLDTLAVHSVTIDQDGDSYAIAKHLSYLVRLLRENDSAGKYSEIGRSNVKTYYSLPPIEQWGKTSFVDWFVKTISYNEMIRFPMFGGAEENGSCDGRAGSTMLRRQSKARGFLTKMGYLEEEKQYEEYSIQLLGLDEITILLRGKYTPVSRYHVIRDIPVWYTHVPDAL